MKNLIVTLTLTSLSFLLPEKSDAEVFDFGIVEEVYEASPFLFTLQDGNCPGGVCPIPRSVVSSPKPVKNVVTLSSGPSWTWPGNLSNHLRQGHGVNTNGMSQAQMVQLHNSLHNGRSASYSVYRASYRYPRIVQSYNRPVYSARLFQPRTWFPRLRARRGW